MEDKNNISSIIKKWLNDNIVCLFMVVVFAILFAITSANESFFEKYASCDWDHFNHEYYRWFTTIFLHFSFGHIFFNSLALIAIGSMVSPFIGKTKTLLTFVICGALSEAIYTTVVSGPEILYSAGSSGGIFGLMAVFMACYLRYPDKFKMKIYRLDVIIVIVYFFAANDNIPSFLTHAFGFGAGVILAFTYIVCKSYLKGKNIKEK